MTRPSPLRRPARLLVALALAGALAACDEPLRQPPLAKGVEPPVATRVMVLAGDTLIIDGRHYHLANVVTPQSIPDARCWAEALGAKHAVQRVKQLLRDARTIKIRPTGQFDGYNRTLAYISLDGLDLGQTLYDEGTAAKPADGVFRWCEQISRELDGAPRWGSLSEPGR